MEESRKCARCGRELPYEAFYKRGNNALQSWCKMCQKEHGRLRNGTTGIYKKDIPMNELVFNNNGKALTNSLLVAQKFGKEHKHVLDGIRKILDTAENSAVLGMFAASQYVNEKNSTMPMFVMNRDGFTLLAMGFTGKKAMQFKLDYIAAFNNMEASLKKPMSELEILVHSAQALLDQSKRIDNVEQRLDQMEREREENGRLLLEVRLSDNVVPEIPLRDKIRQLVNRYAAAANIDQRDVWHKIYEELYYKYKISIRSYKKKARQTNLDVAEEHKFLQPMYDIISNMVRNLESK